MSHKIQLLDETVANQIAAGEVVERPASSVKELVENSLDAGARRIEIDIEEGGRKLVRVVDDGCGMGREDALLCLERHATSKVKTSADLASISTFGFRGEALASIASVSDMRLKTCEEGSVVGTEVHLAGGRILSVQDAGVPRGTSVEVRRLFFNTPARRKFLRAEKTEAALIESLVRTMALAHPEVFWRYRSEGRLVWELPASTPLRRLRDVLGPSLIEGMWEVDMARDSVSLRGWIGRPGMDRSARGGEWWFVNHRPVESRLLSYALRDGLAETLPKGRYPMAVLFLEIEPTRVDVNVHPAKREVRFHGEPEIRELIREAIGEAIAQGQGRGRPLSAPSQPPSPARGQPSEPPSSDAGEAVSSREQTGHAPIQPEGHPIAMPPRAKSWEEERAQELPLEQMHTEWPDVAPGTPLRLKFLGTALGRYLIAQSDHGLVIIDQQAAHERVLFERTLKGQMQSEAPSQRLLVPVTVELPPREAAFLSDLSGVLEEAGLSVNLFGRHSFLVEAVPPWWEISQVAQKLSDLVSELLEEGSGHTRRKLTAEQCAAAVARVSVRGESLQSNEIEKLIEDLLSCDLPYTCPKGRPTMLLFSPGELAGRFGRSRTRS